MPLAVSLETECTECVAIVLWSPARDAKSRVRKEGRDPTKAGGRDWTRTSDPARVKRVRYQLRHASDQISV